MRRESVKLVPCLLRPRKKFVTSTSVVGASRSKTALRDERETGTVMLWHTLAEATAARAARRTDLNIMN